MTMESLCTVRDHLSGFVDRAEREPEYVVVTRNGRPVTVLIGWDTALVAHGRHIEAADAARIKHQDAERALSGLDTREATQVTSPIATVVTADQRATERSSPWPSRSRHRRSQGQGARRRRRHRANRDAILWKAAADSVGALRVLAGE